MVAAPFLDLDLHTMQRVEGAAVQSFTSEPVVEAFKAHDLPGRSWFDESSLRVNGSNPGAHLIPQELSVAARADDFRDTAYDERSASASTTLVEFSLRATQIVGTNGMPRGKSRTVMWNLLNLGLRPPDTLLEPRANGRLVTGTGLYCHASETAPVVQG